MKYFSVAEARKMNGLRLVLTAHVPGPWGESAKAIFKARNIDFIPVEQIPFGENAELCEWTGGIRNAPIAILDDEPPVHGWLDLVSMAERLGSGPSLIPDSSVDRAVALGLSAELCAPWGFGWARRLLIFERSFGLGENLKNVPPHIAVMLQQYGYSEAAVKAARHRTADILSTLAAQRARQDAAGLPYFTGNRPSTIDYHWACFSQMVAPLDLDRQPNMPASLIEKYSDIDEAVANALHPSLIAHRDMMFRDHIGLPLDF
jgi:glutathione S-transferase